MHTNMQCTDHVTILWCHSRMLSNLYLQQRLKQINVVHTLTLTSAAPVAVVLLHLPSNAMQHTIINFDSPHIISFVESHFNKNTCYCMCINCSKCSSATLSLAVYLHGLAGIGFWQVTVRFLLFLVQHWPSLFKDH